MEDLKIGLELTKEEEADVALFKKKYAAWLSFYKKDFPGSKPYFHFIDDTLLIGITNSPKQVFKKDIERNTDFGANGIPRQIVQRIIPFISRIERIVFLSEKKPFFVELKSGLWLVLAPYQYEAKDIEDLKEKKEG